MPVSAGRTKSHQFTNSTAKGWAWFKPTNDSVAYQVNATGLDKVTAAHIHLGKVGEWNCGCSFVRTVRQRDRTY